MLSSIFGFFLVITIIVFIHELGHYIAARLCGVAILEFSIGFGKILLQFKDSNNTFWRIRLLPFGGFVKMLGDENIYSNHLSSEKTISANSFAKQTAIKRAFIAAAGPFANYLLAFTIILCLYMHNGKYYASNQVGEVLENSPAMNAGILKNDIILSIDGKKIKTFEEIYYIVSLIPQKTISLEIERDSIIHDISLITGAKEILDKNGKVIAKIGIIGVGSKAPVLRALGFQESVIQTSSDIINISIMTFTTVKQMLFGSRSTDELRGALTIANESGKNLKDGFTEFIVFIAMLSINIGFINLLPIPILDGGHLLYCFYEIIFAKQPNKKIVSVLNKFGLIVVIFMFVFSTSNDIKALLF